MATYTFLGGDFNNKLDWNPQGIPGAGDTIQDAGAAINAEGETVANAYGIDGDPIVVIGGLNITDVGYDLELQQGDYSVGSIQGAAYIFNDTAVSAGSIDLTLSNQALSLDDTSSLTVSGSVVANGDTIDTASTFDVNGGVSVTNGTLEIDSGATTIGGELGLDTGSYLDLYGGSATAGSLNVNASTVDVSPSSSGATLDVKGAATLSNGANLYVTTGGQATFATLTGGSSSGQDPLQPGFHIKITIEIGGRGSKLDVKNDLLLKAADSFLEAVHGGTAKAGTLLNAGTTVIQNAGSNLDVVDSITQDPNAVLDVQDGGTVTAGSATADGTIGVSGVDSTFTVNKTLILGSTNTGGLTVAGGAALTAGAFDMAENAGSTSNLKVGDAGAAMTIKGLWQIGVAGTATATITQGVTANANGGVTLGVQSAGNGTLTVSQANTVLSVTGDIVIGEAGAGTLNAQAAAIVDAAGSDVTVGEQNTAIGAATIDGAGSQFKTASLTVGGASSNATVTVSAGGDLEIATDLTLAEQAGSDGAMSVTDAGSQVSTGGNATLGEDGSGTLTMTGGGMSAAGAMTLGENKGSSGKMTLSDATVSITGDLNIGEAGSGSAIVQLGSVLKSKAIELGGALGAKGSLTVSGAGTSVTTGETTIGAGGTGTLKITSGGLLTTNGDATIGSVAIGAIVSTSLDSGGQWLVGGNLDVGDSSAGTLSIAGKGTLVTVDGDMTIGAAAGGTVTLGSTTAASSARLKWENLLTVGEGAKGTLTINAGDKVSALAGGAGQLAIGADAGSSGTVSLAGTGASLSGASLFIGGTASKAGGAGSLSISAGATTTFADATIWATGKATDAGALSISGPLSGSGSVQISGAGQFTLGGPDSTAGIDFVSGGSNERLDLSAAHLPSVDIKGFGANDTIDVSGLSTSDTIAVSYKGAVATVRFLQAGKTVGTLHFATKAGQGTFHFDAADGALTFTPKAAAPSLQDQIFDSALLSNTLAYHPLDVIGGRGSTGASATPDLWSVGHAPGGS